MDDIDRYTEFEQEMIDKRIRMVRQNVASSEGALGAERCQDCASEIPMARRKAIPTAIRCVSCQEEYERG